MKKIISYGRQSIDDNDIFAVVDALKSDYLTTGPRVDEFEREFAKYVGAKYAVAVANGTAALHLACMAAELGPGDEVITTPMTFAASANCALYVGAIPIFADIDKTTKNIDPAEIEKRITPHTRAIIPVHYTGLAADLKEINRLARKHNLLVIEDACHALGAKYYNTKIGDCFYSDMAVFSFHPVKHITTCEGGMITTNNEDIYKKLRLLRTHGISRDDTSFEINHGGWYYEMKSLGFNYRLSDVQCALGTSQLKKVESYVAKRRKIADKYSSDLKGASLHLPVEPEGYKNSYHLYTVNISDDSAMNRKEIYDRLKEKGIHCQVHYVPVHLFPYYKEKFGYKSGDFPVAEKHYWSTLSLPIYPALAKEDLRYVINSLKEVCL